MATEIVNGYYIRLRKGASRVSPQQRTAVELLMSNPPRAGLRRGAGCPIITFRDGEGGYTASQRCEGRKLSTDAKRRWSKLKGKVICRDKRIGRKHLFKRCGK